jgi:hypothetical protein
MMLKKNWLFLLAIAGSLSGCAVVFDARNLGTNVRMAQTPDQQGCPTPFQRSQKAVYLLWGLIPASRPSLEQVLASQVTGTEEITQLRIRMRSRFTDLLVTGLTGGLVVPRSVTFEGCVVPGSG